MDFQFHEDGHYYTLGAERLPSVTSLIADAGLSDYSMVNPDVLERARQWGNALHRMVELYLKEDLDEEALDEPLRPCLKALNNWLCENGRPYPSGVKIETPTYHPKLRYAGTADIVFPDLIIDIKSRKPIYPNDEIQLMLYDKMDGGDREHRILVLNPDGTYLYQKVNATKARRNESWRRARFLIDLYYRKEEIKKWT